MRGVLAVYRKEMATYLRSPIAYYVVAVFLLGTGYFFLYNTFLTGETAMAGTFFNMGLLLVTLAPLISMRLFSAEYTSGTAELLLTLPLSPWQIVLAKYLSVVAVYSDLEHRHGKGGGQGRGAGRGGDKGKGRGKNR